MYTFELFILLMALSFLLVGVAQRLKVPYPLILVIGGAVIGFLPGLHAPILDPNLVLVIVLPPLLQFGAFWLSYADLKRYYNDILSLALGLVALTTIVVACAFKWFFPGLPWALAFTFGALVSPPDAVSAASILKRFHISSRIVTILEGESLINDAFALLFYKFSLVALLTSTFTLADFGIQFVWISLGGLAVGAIVAYIFHTALWRFSHSVVAVLFSYVMPYIVYISALWLEVSGVLALVASGLVTSAFFVKRYDTLRRMLGVATWSMFVIVLNCFVFILIGLELGDISQRTPVPLRFTYTGYAILIFAIMFVVRLVWVSAKYVVCFKRTCDESVLTSFREGAIISWCGMRGIISLACALALPLNVPGRDAIIFITFVVIFCSLLLPALTLPRLLNWLKASEAPDEETQKRIRADLLDVAHSVIETLHHLQEEERQFLKVYIDTRHVTREIQAPSLNALSPLEEARRTLLQKQREFLLKLHEQGQIDEKLLKHLELELDFEEHLSIRPDSFLA